MEAWTALEGAISRHTWDGVVSWQVIEMQTTAAAEKDVHVYRIKYLLRESKTRHVTNDALTL